MSTISLRLSDSLHELVKLMAARDKVSINQSRLRSRLRYT